MDQASPSRRSIAIAAIAVTWIAVALRVPSCYESFWLDELHSAWTIWGNLGEVLPRADIGHQSPFYFIAIWFWKQLFGDSEFVLRMSSVVAVAASAAILTVGVSRWTQSLVAGVVAGLVIAVESNALFFGTELRPYAFVILFSSIAVVCFLRLIALASRHRDRRAWVGMIVATLLAVLCQPTAGGVLAWFFISLLLVWWMRDRRELLRFNVSDALLLLSTAAVAFALWRVTLGETWQQRASWSTFATATRIGQIWEVWDWTWLMLVPLAVLSVAARLQRSSPSVRSICRGTVALASISVAATCLFWVVSRTDWIPVWHRRYFIATLPIFACVTGGAFGVVDSVARRHRLLRLAAAFVALTLILALAHQQGTLTRLRTYPVALVIRGEDWRSAIAWVNASSEPKDLVFLDAGLIESNAWLQPTHRALTARQLDYLVFAVHGPYDAETDVVPIDARRLPPQWRVVSSLNGRDRRVFIILRKVAHQVRQSLPPDYRVVGFGNVSIVVQSSDLTGQRL